MSSKLGYDRQMRYWTLVSAFTLLVLASVSGQGQTTQGQANGVPPSVTSFGFGGQPGFNGPPPSVTSVRPNGFTAGNGVGFHQPLPGPISGHHHHRQSQTYFYPYFIPYYPVMDPYAYGGPVAGDAPADTEEQDQYEGGPTVFDRRGPGELAPNDYAKEESDSKGRVAKSTLASDVKPTPVSDGSDLVTTDSPRVAPVAGNNPPPLLASQPNTILVFKDGHKQEVGNYAIVGANLFDLTPGHRLKIALAELDVPATQKANEEQGVDFTLPAVPKGN